MKKSISLIAALLIAASSFAQDVAKKVSFVPSVGINLANITSDDCETKNGLTIGGELHYRTSNPISLSGGIFFSQQGCKGVVDGISAKLNNNYLNVPLLLNVHLGKGFTLKTGLQPAFLLSAKIAATQGKASASVDAKELYHTFDFSIPSGISYEMGKVVLDLRYNVGILNLLKDVPNNENGRNKVVQFMIGYRL